MHSTTFCLSLMASSVLGLKINFQRFSEENCNDAFHINSSSQHDVIIESDKGCQRFVQQVPFESYLAEVIKGHDQMDHNICRVEVFESDDCSGDGFTMGDLLKSSGDCGNPQPNGYHGSSAQVVCDPIADVPSVHVVSMTLSTPTTRPATSCCTSMHIKTVTASIPTISALNIHGSTFDTTVIRLTPVTFSGQACSLAPEVTSSASAAASAYASSLMLGARSVPTSTPVSNGDDALTPKDAELFKAHFTEVMEREMAEACEDDDE